MSENSSVALAVVVNGVLLYCLVIKQTHIPLCVKNLVKNLHYLSVVFTSRVNVGCSFTKSNCHTAVLGFQSRTVQTGRRPGEMVFNRCTHGPPSQVNLAVAPAL